MIQTSRRIQWLPYTHCHVEQLASSLVRRVAVRVAVTPHLRLGIGPVEHRCYYSAENGYQSALQQRATRTAARECLSEGIEARFIHRSLPLLGLFEQLKDPMVPWGAACEAENAAGHTLAGAYNSTYFASMCILASSISVTTLG
jgi:hypothetical protein